MKARSIGCDECVSPEQDFLFVGERRIAQMHRTCQAQGHPQPWSIPPGEHPAIL